MQTTDGADALASVFVKNLQNFLLVGWSVGRRRLKHMIASEVLALHAKWPPSLQHHHRISIMSLSLPEV
jgi:hypothetical protein